MPVTQRWIATLLLRNTGLNKWIPTDVRRHAKCQFHQHFTSSICKKAARKMLVKLTPAVNFINIICTRFLYNFFCQSKNVTRNVTREKRTCVRNICTQNVGEINIRVTRTGRVPRVHSNNELSLSLLVFNSGLGNVGC